MERFSEAVEEGEVGADYDKAENFTSPLATMLKVNQPISFWQLFPAVFSRIIRRQGREILGPGKERLVKDLAFSIMKRMVYKSDFLRHRAVLCLLLIVKVKNIKVSVRASDSWLNFWSSPLLFITVNFL